MNLQLVLYLLDADKTMVKKERRKEKGGAIKREGRRKNRRG